MTVTSKLPTAGSPADHPEARAAAAPAFAGEIQAQGFPIRYRPLWWLGLLLLCAPYLQGGLVKLTDFDSALAEIQHFGLASSGLWTTVMAAGTIALELGASLLVLSGRGRSLGALALGAFTLMATFIANRYWSAPPEARFAQANSFYEHLALTGAWLLVALASWPRRGAGLHRAVHANDSSDARNAA